MCRPTINLYSVRAFSASSQRDLVIPQKETAPSHRALAQQGRSWVGFLISSNIKGDVGCHCHSQHESSGRPETSEITVPRGTSFCQCFPTNSHKFTL